MVDDIRREQNDHIANHKDLLDMCDVPGDGYTAETVNLLFARLVKRNSPAYDHWKGVTFNIKNVNHSVEPWIQSHDEYSERRTEKTIELLRLRDRLLQEKHNITDTKENEELEEIKQTIHNMPIIEGVSSRVEAIVKERLGIPVSEKYKMLPTIPPEFSLLLEACFSSYFTEEKPVFDQKIHALLSIGKTVVIFLEARDPSKEEDMAAKKEIADNLCDVSKELQELVEPLLALKDDTTIEEDAYNAILLQIRDEKLNTEIEYDGMNTKVIMEIITNEENEVKTQDPKKVLGHAL
jgi:hypothetical protein